MFTFKDIHRAKKVELVLNYNVEKKKKIFSERRWNVFRAKVNALKS